LGDLAYPVYLLHWPMFALATMMTPVAVVPLALLLTVILSFAVFWFVDRPLEARRHQFVARRMDVAEGAPFSSPQSNPQVSAVQL
jgi:peptidoglycan/LPS O-acetylase OafA/YrhL